jgi:DNA end-binding protein Ku
MRTSWNGSLSFGLVSIPVGLAPATKPAARTSDVSFRMLHRECGTPIKQKRYCPKHERDLEPDEIVKGWEIAKGQFVLVEEAELEALAQHDDSRSIEITRFVDATEVDPIFFDRTYFAGRAPALRAAPERDDRYGHGRPRPVRAAREGEVLPHPCKRRRACTRDALPLR